MNADIKWLDNPEVFRVNQLEAHSDHEYYMSYADLESKNKHLEQSLNGEWDFFSHQILHTLLLAASIAGGIVCGMTAYFILKKMFGPKTQRG